MSSQTSSPIQVLHLMGSPTSTFYFDLSVMYGRTAAEFEGLDRVNFVHKFAVVFTDGRWGFPASVDSTTLEQTDRLTMGAALANIESWEHPVDVVMPHMFCVEGMTRYRAICEMMGLEVLGCPAHTCTIANDKFLTKQACKAAGVPVPDGEQLRADMHGVDVEATAKDLLKRRQAPFIVKPAREDNSIGLALVKSNDLEVVTAALSNAFKYDDHILVEEYIAGRECRVAVLEVEDESGSTHMQVLPKIEYLLDDIRTSQHKLSTDSTGNLLTSDGDVAAAIVNAKKEGDRVCPAQFSPEVHQRLDDLACRAHKALSCKYYSLYDVRINEDGYPFMLEAALFCSFSPYSVVVALADKAGDEKLRPHPRIFEMFLRRAAAATRKRRAAKALASQEEKPAIGGAMRRSPPCNEPAVADKLGQDGTASTVSGGALQSGAATSAPEVALGA